MRAIPRPGLLAGSSPISEGWEVVEVSIAKKRSFSSLLKGLENYRIDTRMGRASEAKRLSILQLRFLGISLLTPVWP